MRFSAQTAATFFVTTCLLLAAAGKSSAWVTHLQEPARNNNQSTPSTNPITVAYCDLLRDPDSYDRKLIRVKAIYAAHFEMSALQDSACSQDFQWAWVDFDEKHPTCTKPEVSASFEAAVAANRPERTEEEMKKAEVVFVGWFEVAHNFKLRNLVPRNGFGHMGMYRFRLTVTCIEEVKPLPPK